MTLPMRLLCADDEADIRTILALALGLDPSIEAEVVSSGTEMLRQAAHGGWDGFLLDGMMPGLDGFEVCERLKANPATSGVPVIFLTAKTQREELARALAAGAVACLVKPFDPMTLASDVRAALGR